MLLSYLFVQSNLYTTIYQNTPKNDYIKAKNIIRFLILYVYKVISGYAVYERLWIAVSKPNDL